MYDIGIPDIMGPRGLKTLNEYAIQKLGTPIFFYAPDLVRPSATCAEGLFYEVVTGLYIIYKDYGMRMLLSFLFFCKDNRLFVTNPFNHYNCIINFRGALCHGSFPGGLHQNRLTNSMSAYCGSDKNWPEYFNTIDSRELNRITISLKKESDKFVLSLRKNIDTISLNKALLEKWRKTLADNVFDPNGSSYGDSRFDKRILTDIECPLRRRSERKPYRTTVQRWLNTVRKMILNGTISDSDVLYTSLKEALTELYCPSVLPNRNSASILLDGLDLDSLV